jgi:hypothetical protein
MQPTTSVRGRRRTRLLIASILSGVIGAAPALTSAAVVTVDFGAVPVGTTVTEQVLIPSEVHLSDLPADLVVYTGGDPTVDAILVLLGLTAPVTTGAILGAIGDITITYELIALDLADGTNFAIGTFSCDTTGCLIEASFTPTAGGTFTDTVTVTVGNVAITGGGLLGPLATLFIDLVRGFLDDTLVVDLTGAGEEGQQGIELRVTVPEPAAPCLLVGAPTLDFGELPLSTPSAMSSGSMDVDVTSCSTGSTDILARGTDASGDGIPPATWLLSSVGENPCTQGADLLGVVLAPAGGSALQLATSNEFMASVVASETLGTNVTLEMACEGSEGAGQTMSSQVFLTAVVP